MSQKQFIIMCVVFVGICILSNYFAPAGYALVIICIAAGLVVAYATVRAIINTINDAKKK